MSGITILIIAAAGMAVLLGGVTPLPDKTKKYRSLQGNSPLFP